MKKNEVIVSIIVCVYNGEKYLSRCLDSIFNQTLTMFEIIVVDDGSTDNSLSIIQRYANEDTRIKVVAVENNQGLVSARKSGIKQAEGMYIGFVDADDWIAPNAYETLVCTARKNDIDLLIFDYYEITGNSRLHKKSFNGTKLDCGSFMRYSSPPFLCCKLFHCSLKNYMFSATGKGAIEDVSLLYPLLPHVKNIGYRPEPLYYYFKHDASDSASDSFREKNKIDEYLIPLRHLFTLDYGNYNNLAYSHFVQMVYWGLTNPQRQCFKANYVEFLQEVSPKIIGNPQMKRFNNLSNYLCHQTIPKCVITIKEDENKVISICKESKEKYISDFDIVYVNELCFENLPMIITEAKNSNELVFVYDYLSLRYIYENGGNFISQRVKINNPIGELRMFSAFFVLDENCEINTEIWGGLKGNRLLGEILETYQPDHILNKIHIPLSKRIYFSLCKYYNIKEINGESYYSENVKIFNQWKLLYKMNVNNITQIYSDINLFAENNGYYIIPDAGITSLTTSCQQENSKTKLQDNKRIKELNNEINRIKTSRSWLLTRPFRKIFNFFRKVKYSDNEIN